MQLRKRICITMKPCNNKRNVLVLFVLLGVFKIYRNNILELFLWSVTNIKPLKKYFSFVIIQRLNVEVKL